MSDITKVVKERYGKAGLQVLSGTAGKWVNERQGEASFRSFSYATGLGGGFRVPLLGTSLTIDYAYTNMGELQNVHAFSFELGGTQ